MSDPNATAPVGDPSKVTADNPEGLSKNELKRRRKAAEKAAKKAAKAAEKAAQVRFSEPCAILIWGRERKCVVSLEVRVEVAVFPVKRGSWSPLGRPCHDLGQFWWIKRFAAAW